MLSAGSLLWSPPTDFRAADDDYFNDVTVQPDGKIVAVGVSHRPSGDNDFLIARYTVDGHLDAGFNGTGWTVVDFGSGRQDSATSVALQSNGKIVVGGTTDFDFGFVRLNADGSVDPTFGTAGQTIVDLGAADSLESIALTSTGKIVASGKFEDVGNSIFMGAVVRLNSDGTLDNTFSGDGELLTLTDVVSVAVDSSDRILLADAAATVGRLLTDGTYDASFGTGGTMAITFDLGANERLAEIAIDSAGRIVVVGHSLDGMFDVGGVARLLAADGSYDTTFDSDGHTSIDLVDNASDTFLDVVALPNGGLAISGLVATGGRQYSSLLVLTPSGALDTAFDTDGATFYDPGDSSFPGGLAVTPEGNYVIAGRFSPMGGDAEPFLAAFSGLFVRRDDIAGRTKAGNWWVADSGGGSFTNVSFGSWGTTHSWKYVASADFNGDGIDDVAGRDANGDWWVGINNGSSFPIAKWMHWNEAAGWKDVHFADFNGDGLADVVGQTASNQWWLMLSTGTGFTLPTNWVNWRSTAGWQNLLVADFTGDGRADIAGRTSAGYWFVSATSDSGPVTQRWGWWTPNKTWSDVQTGDFNGDGLVDIIGHTQNGAWLVGLSSGNSFTTTSWSVWDPAAGWHDSVVGDFNGDGYTDIASRTSSGKWWVGLSNGSTGFTNARWGAWTESEGWKDVRVGDFDGDGKSDIAGRNSAGVWKVARSTGAAFDSQDWTTWNEVAGWTTYSDEFLLT